MAGPTARFLTGSVMGHVARMTLTATFGLTFMFLVDAANLFWVSRLGQEGLVAALGFAWTVQFFTISSGIGLMIAATAMVSKFIGQGRRDEARRATTISATASVAVQIVMAVLILLFRHDILALAGAKGQTAVDAARYLLISVPSLPLMALGMVGAAVLRAEGDAYRAMWVTMSSGIISMFIDPFLIIWAGLGLDGAAIAVVFARVFSAGLSVFFMMRVHDLAGKITFADLQRLVVPFLFIAFPAVLTQLSTPFGNYLLTAVIAGFGDGAVAGWAVVTRLTILAFGGIFALSGAVGGIIGQNYGAKIMARVKRTYIDALIFCFCYTMVAWAVLAFFSETAVTAFGLGEDGAVVVRAFTQLAAGGFVFAGALFVANSAFNNLGRPLYSTLFNWARDGVIIFPVALWMSAIFAAPGVIYGQALAGVLVGTVACTAGWIFVHRLALRIRSEDAV